MSKLNEVVAAAGEELGLRRSESGTSALGERHGYPVQVAATEQGNSPGIEVRIRIGEVPTVPTAPGGKDLQKAIRDAEAVKRDKLRRSAIKVEDGVVRHFRPKPSFRGAPDRAQIVLDATTLLEVTRSVAPAPPSSCRRCGGSRRVETLLVDGMVDRVCSTCLDNARFEGERLSREYASRDVNLVIPAVAGGITAALGAVAWGAVVYFVREGTRRKFEWKLALIGAGIGAAVGWVTAKTAGRVGRAAQVLAVVLTLAAMAAGQAVSYAIEEFTDARDAGRDVDWNAFVGALPETYSSDIRGVLLALAGGVVGAYYAVQRARPPKFASEVERVT